MSVLEFRQSMPQLSVRQFCALRRFKVLVIVRNVHQARDVMHHVTCMGAPEISVCFPSSLTDDERAPDLDIDQLYADCKHLVREERVDGVIAFHPLMDVVLSMLCTDLPRLRGPSANSTLLCLHRTYCRQVACANFNVDYVNVFTRDALDRSGLQATADDLERPWKVIDAIPAFAQELDVTIGGRDTSNNSVVDSMTMQRVAGAVAASRAAIMNFYTTYVNRQTFGKTMEKTCVVLDIPEIGRDVESMHLVEGCVQGGQPIPWVIGDMLVERSRPSSRHVVGWGFPTILGELHQFELWGVFRLVAQRLIAFGFNNRFLRLTCFLTSEGGVKINDVTSGIFLPTAHLYESVYAGGNSVRAAFGLCIGQVVATPKRLSRRYGLLANVNCYVTDGTKLMDLIRFDAVDDIAEMEMLVTDSWLRMTPDTYGLTLARIAVSGRSYKTCRRKIRRIYKLFLRPGADNFSWRVHKSSPQT